MLIRAIDRADVTVQPMAFQADLLFRSRFARDVNGTIEVAQHSVVQLLHTIELGLEVSSRAGTNMAIDTRQLSMGGMLGSDKLRLHWHMTTLTAKIDRLGILISLVTAERSQKKKTHSAECEQRQDSPVTFPRQVDLENAMFLFNLRCAALLTFVQDRAQECQREPEKEEERCDDVREDSNVGIFCGSEEIDREEQDKSE